MNDKQKPNGQNQNSRLKIIEKFLCPQSLGKYCDIKWEGCSEPSQVSSTVIQEAFSDYGLVPFNTRSLMFTC